jgi:hypothetical protein
LDNIFSKAVSIVSGRLNRRTQRVTAWNDASIDYTSAFVTNIQNKIASEIVKVSYNHVKYKKNPKGADTLISMAGSDIDEVLNWSPKGRKNSIEFWTDVVKQLMATKYVTLVPKIDKSTGELLDLLFLNDSGVDEPDFNKTVNLVSPFYINDDTSILDNALTSIATKLDQGKIRALYKVNAHLDFDFVDDYREKANKTIENMQKAAKFNGIVPMDAKGDLIELKKDYSVLNSEEIDLIKSELLSAYFMNEKVLLGTATQEEQIYFYNSTIIPILVQLEKELSYKLISNSRRREKEQNLYYERIMIDNQLFKFATLKELIDLYHENTNAPVFTQNQLLAMMGEQPIEGGDIYISNLNAVAVDNLSDLKGTRKDEEEKVETNQE